MGELPPDTIQMIVTLAAVFGVALLLTFRN